MKSIFKKIQTPRALAQLPSQLGQSNNYEDWRNSFLKDRLRFLYLVAVFGNPSMFLVDYFQGDQRITLFLLRILMETFWILGFLIVRFKNDILQPNGLLIFWVLGANICISEMTVVLGGFSSLYYIGLNLMFLCAAVIVPVSWKSHAIAQLSSLIYYLVANIFRSQGIVNLADVSLNLMLLIWTCIALTVSVYLYERLHRAEFEARMKLLELDRLKSEFFANVSHEL
ncbi:MAG: hypothetical protein KC592_19525, partial [Nitrospira sp.]|nr:hypothetical protein [Nitrospira sp.]